MKRFVLVVMLASLPFTIQAADREFQNKVKVKFDLIQDLYLQGTLKSYQTTEDNFYLASKEVVFCKVWKPISNTKVNTYIEKDFNRRGKNNNTFTGVDVEFKFDLTK